MYRSNKHMHKFNFFQKYILNCFLLVLPVLAWNILLTSRLPQAFQPEIFAKAVPPVISMSENAFRILLFAMMFFMPLRISTAKQKRGFAVYMAGVLIYFASWLALIYFPESTWSRNWAGFMAPAYTPLLWLAGIGLSGDKFYLNLHVEKWVYYLLAVLFALFHNLHTYLIYIRLN